MAVTAPGFDLAHVGVWTFDFTKMVDFYVSLFGFIVSDRGSKGVSMLSLRHRRRPTISWSWCQAAPGLLRPHPAD